jgi:hypothetical protein
LHRTSRVLVGASASAVVETESIDEWCENLEMGRAWNLARAAR